MSKFSLSRILLIVRLLSVRCIVYIRNRIPTLLKFHSEIRQFMSEYQPLVEFLNCWFVNSHRKMFLNSLLFGLYKYQNPALLCSTNRAPSCFELSWPWRLEAGFFKKPKQIIYSEADRYVSSCAIGTTFVTVCLWSLMQLSWHRSCSMRYVRTL